jgi:hypothetical protein
MTMAYPPSDQPGAGGSPDLRRSVGEATERIHEIIDAAERVASDIRTDAEAEARTYVTDRRAEADRAAQERSRALDELTRSLADTAERFKHQAERMLAELDQAIVEARAGVYRHGAVAALGDDPAPAPAPPPPAPSLTRFEPEPEPVRQPEPVAPERDPLSFESLSREPRRTRKPAGLEPLPPLEPQDDPFELPPLDPGTIERDRPRAAVSAYPGRDDRSWRDEAPAPSADQTSEALLRATQLAVTGKGRDEITDILRADYPGLDTKPLLDEILG